MALPLAACAATQWRECTDARDKVNSPIAPAPHTRSHLARAFLARAEDIPGYAARVAAECAHFPEGDLFPFVFPAIGLLTLARAGHLDNNRTRAASLAFLSQARRTVIGRLGSLLSLRPGVRQAVYLGWLALEFALHRAVTGDPQFDEERRHLSEVMLDELESRKGLPLDSFPGVVWPFDTIPTLVALASSDRIDQCAHSSAAIRRHLSWIEASGSDPVTGLPWSKWDLARQSAPEPPRGCDLALRTGMLHLIDPAAAALLYRRYTRAYWQEWGVVAGFREWSHGTGGSADADSGPLIAGLGMAASGFGIGAAAVMGDRWRTWRLCTQLCAVEALVWVGLRAQRVVPIRERLGLGAQFLDPRARTGFLFWDVCLFLTLTWPVALRSSSPSSATDSRS